MILKPTFYSKLILDDFDLGHDIQMYYTLYQSITLEDLAKPNGQHTVKGILKVVSKVSWRYLLVKS